MAINEKRTKNMKKRSEKELLDIVKSGSLSAAAAAYELKARGFNKSAEDLYDGKQAKQE